MKASFSSHVPEQLLERYALHQLDEEQLAIVEEHLLICPACQDHLTQVDEYVQALKLAATEVRNRRSGHGRWLPDFRRIPVAAYLLATTTIVALALVIPWQGRNVPYHEVILEAARGASPIPVAEASAGSFLVLRMDVSEIVRSGGYEVSVVNSVGRELWRAGGHANQNQLSIPVSVRLSAGRYWIRLFDTSQPPDLLREYGLELR